MKAQRREKQNRSLVLEKFINDIESRPLAIDEFDEKLWTAAVDKVTVTPEGKLIFSFNDGIEIEE